MTPSTNAPRPSAGAAAPPLHAPMTAQNSSTSAHDENRYRVISSFEAPSKRPCRSIFETPLGSDRVLAGSLQTVPAFGPAGGDHAGHGHGQRADVLGQRRTAEFPHDRPDPDRAGLWPGGASPGRRLLGGAGTAQDLARAPADHVAA